MPPKKPKVAAEDEFAAAPVSTRKLIANLGVEVCLLRSFNNACYRGFHDLPLSIHRGQSIRDKLT